MSNANYGTCRSCRASVLWARSAANGKAMPLDRDAERGNIVLDELGRAHVFRDHDVAEARIDERDDLPIGSTFISHHAVCREGKAWQGKTRERDDAPAPNAEPAQGALEI